MEGVVPNPSSAKAGVASWLGRHPGVVPLLLAVLVGLLAFPAAARALNDHDVLINNRISLIHAVWLGLAIILSIILLAARSSLVRDLGDGTRRVLAGTQTSDASSRIRSASPDIPSLGVAIVDGIFDLILLLIVQGILREPLVEIVSIYAPKPLVDGAFVVLVVLIALIMLFGLHRVSQPLTEHLVTVGLDRLVPTAGFAAAALPDAPTRTTTRTPSSASGTRGTAQPTVAAAAIVPASSEATVAAPAEATVAAVDATPSWSSEATVAEPSSVSSATGPGSSSPAEATVLEAPPASTPAGEATRVESPVVAASETTGGADATILEESPAKPEQTAIEEASTSKVERTTAGDKTIVEDERAN